VKKSEQSSSVKAAREKYLDWDDVQEDGLPACSFCSSLRRYRALVPRGHDDFGKLLPCPVCGALAVRKRMQNLYREKQNRIEKYSLLCGEAADQTFDIFDLRRDEGDDTIPVRIAYAKAKAFADDPHDFLVLHGSRGTGKSHLAAAIANKVKDSTEELPPLVLFFVVPEFLELLRTGYDEGDYQELLDLSKSVDLLILDDLGAESETSWAHEKLFQVINRRYINHLPMVVATNCRLSELPARIYSRLADDRNTVVSVTAPDYRQRERNPGEVI
jgi:DNA replication protein DnaC